MSDNPMIANIPLIENLPEFKHGLIAVCDMHNGEGHILHFVGFPKKPSEVDKASMEHELNTDPEFGLVGRINKDVFIIDAPQHVCDHFLSNPSRN